MRSSTDTMTATRTSPVPDTALVAGPDGLRTRRIRRRDTLLAGVLSCRLDAQLAAGQEPELRWLRAVRATQLVRPAGRARLADAWAGVLDPGQQAVRRRFGTTAHPAIHDHADLVAELVDQLRVPTPVAARGVAAATVLLTDGTGPLFRPRSAEHLPAALTAALRQLEPAR